MQPTNENPNLRATDLEWCLLGEYSLNELAVEMDNRDRTNARLLFQTIRDLGIPPEYLNNIEMTLREFGKEAMERCNQGRTESPVYIRLFCQKTTIEDVYSAISSSRFNTDQTSEASRIIHHSETGINGGWGCFLIKRGCNDSEDASPRSQYFVDLYLYREG